MVINSSWTLLASHKLNNHFTLTGAPETQRYTSPLFLSVIVTILRNYVYDHISRSFRARNT